MLGLVIRNHWEADTHVNTLSRYYFLVSLFKSNTHFRVYKIVMSIFIDQAVMFDEIVAFVHNMTLV